jgi:hypothetical protein
MDNSKVMEYHGGTTEGVVTACNVVTSAVISQW